jgi:hypothetical protein
MIQILWAKKQHYYFFFHKRYFTSKQLVWGFDLGTTSRPFALISRPSKA